MIGTIGRAASYEAMGHSVVSDVPLHGLRATETPYSCIFIQRRDKPFPGLGILTRQIDGDTDCPAILVYESHDGIQYLVGNLAGSLSRHPGPGFGINIIEPFAPNDLENFLIGPVLALALQLGGQVQLHAGAIAAGDCAIAFSAPSGLGKSTLTASFTNAGHSVITDDILGIEVSNEGLTAIPGVPRMKLWTDTLSILGLQEQNYTPALSWLDKRQISIGGEWGTQASRPLPLAALYFLAPHCEPERPITFSELSPSTAALTLLANTYMAESLRGERARRALAVATRMVSTIRIRQVSYWRSYEMLPDLRAALLADACNKQATPCLTN